MASVTYLLNKTAILSAFANNVDYKLFSHVSAEQRMHTAVLDHITPTNTHTRVPFPFYIWIKALDTQDLSK